MIEGDYARQSNEFSNLAFTSGQLTIMSIDFFLRSIDYYVN